jgi:hypothetical protein
VSDSSPTYQDRPPSLPNVQFWRISPWHPACYLSLAATPGRNVEGFNNPILSKGEIMPLVLLPQGKSLSLNEGDKDAVSNPNTETGQYVLSFNLMPLSVQFQILPHAHHPFVVPKGGASIENNGPVDLVVTTPGL